MCWVFDHLQAVLPSLQMWLAATVSVCSVFDLSSRLCFVVVAGCDIVDVLGDSSQFLRFSVSCGQIHNYFLRRRVEKLY